MTKQFITRTTVSRRPGWTLGLVEKILGPPDEKKKVRGFSNELCLYHINRVVTAEQSEDFLADLPKRLERKASAQRAVETKTKDLLNHIATMQITVVQMPEVQLRDKAIQNYNNWQSEKALNSWRDYDSAEPARKNSDPAFLQRISVNYLRHQGTRYDRAIEAMIGKVGNQEALSALRVRIYEAIATAYPGLTAECGRQLEAW